MSNEQSQLKQALAIANQPRWARLVKWDPANCLACRHPEIMDATREYMDGRSPSTIAREYGIPTREFKQHLMRHGLARKRARDPIGSAVALRDEIDAGSVIERASPDMLLKVLLELEKWIALQAGGVTDRHHVVVETTEVEEEASKLTREQILAAEAELSKQLEGESLDAEFEEMPDGADTAKRAQLGDSAAAPAPADESADSGA